MFQPQELERLAPRLQGGGSSANHTERLNGQGLHGLDPLAATEAIAYDFLAKGGKHSRPFITLAAYRALADGLKSLTSSAHNGDGSGHFAIPDAVKHARCRSKHFIKPRWYTTTLKMTTSSATARPRCIGSTGRPRRLTWGIILLAWAIG